MESSSGPQPPRLSAAELYMQININFVQALQARDIVAASRACDQLAQLMPTHPNVIEFRTIIAEHAQTIAARKQQKHSKRGRNATVVAAAAATSSSSSGSGDSESESGDDGDTASTSSGDLKDDDDEASRDSESDVGAVGPLRARGGSSASTSSAASPTKDEEAMFAASARAHYATVSGGGGAASGAYGAERYVPASIAAMADPLLAAGDGTVAPPPEDWAEGDEIERRFLEGTDAEVIAQLERMGILRRAPGQRY